MSGLGRNGSNPKKRGRTCLPVSPPVSVRRLTGGDVLYIETSLLPGSHDMTLTGQLGDVMQESVRACA